MFVSRLRLTNIRCFQNAVLDLSPTINLIFGPNNAGKSTILSSLLLLQQQRLDQHSIRLGESSFRADLILADTAQDSRFLSWRKDPQHVNEPVELSWVMNPNGNGSFQFDVGGPQPGKRELTIQGPIFQSQRPFNFIAPYLAQRRSVPRNHSVGGSHANAVTGRFEFLTAAIDQLLTSNRRRDPFLAACEAIVGFRPSELADAQTSGQKRIVQEIDLDRGWTIPVEEMGDGVVSALALIVDLIEKRQLLYLLEEPEHDLHPMALRALLDLVFSAANSGSQFVITTHSHVVVRHLGSLQTTRLFGVIQQRGEPIPSSTVDICESREDRRQLLRSLGYAVTDDELYDGWLLVEEASAETLIRDFIIRWFVPQLVGRIRTVSAAGVDEVTPRFATFNRMMLFLHLEETYRFNAWVVVDGDDAGRKVAADLRAEYPTWNADHFRSLAQTNIEYYYPKEFAPEVVACLSERDSKRRRELKRALLLRVVDWLNEDEPLGRSALETSARELIDIVNTIAASIIPRNS
jgi:hypothetical protein